MSRWFLVSGREGEEDLELSPWRDAHLEGIETSGHPVYRVFVLWTGRVWMVRVEDPDGYDLGQGQAGRRADVEATALRQLGGTRQHHHQLSDRPELAVHMYMRPAITRALRRAESAGPGAARELDAVVAELRQVRMSGHDIAAFLAARSVPVEPTRPLLIPNAEIARHGLHRRLDLVAVEREDGHVSHTYCRGCVETDRTPWWRSQDGVSAAVYDGPARCDRCDLMITKSSRVDAHPFGAGAFDGAALPRDQHTAKGASSLLNGHTRRQHRPGVTTSSPTPLTVVVDRRSSS